MAFVEEAQEIHPHIQALFKEEEEVKIYRLNRYNNFHSGVDEDGTEDPKDLARIMEQEIGEKKTGGGEQKSIIVMGFEEASENIRKSLKIRMGLQQMGSQS